MANETFTSRYVSTGNGVNANSTYLGIVRRYNSSNGETVVFIPHLSATYTVNRLLGGQPIDPLLKGEKVAVGFLNGYLTEPVIYGRASFRNSTPDPSALGPWGGADLSLVQTHQNTTSGFFGLQGVAGNAEATAVFYEEYYDPLNIATPDGVTVPVTGIYFYALEATLFTSGSTSSNFQIRLVRGSVGGGIYNKIDASAMGTASTQFVLGGVAPVNAGNILQATVRNTYSTSVQFDLTMRVGLLSTMP
ncbi:MAG: hypothetical protein O3A30_03835 [Bacteroidetes bacterium]|nr:hypothetical protein [Bacteroidota bacterium]